MDTIYLTAASQYMYPKKSTRVCDVERMTRNLCVLAKILENSNKAQGLRCGMIVSCHASFHPRMMCNDIDESVIVFDSEGQ